METSGIFNDRTHRSNCHHRKKNDPDLGEIRNAGSPKDGGLDQGEKPLGLEVCMVGHLQYSWMAGTRSGKHPRCRMRGRTLVLGW